MSEFVIKKDHWTLIVVFIGILIAAGIVPAVGPLIENIGATDTANLGESGTGGADTGTNPAAVETETPNTDETSTSIDDVSIEIRSSDKKKMVDDFFISDIQVTNKKIKFSVENRDKNYLQTISTIELVCQFKGEEGKYKPFSYSLYPVHNGKKIKNTEILFFPENKIDLEISLDDGTGNNYEIEKILFYITPQEKIPMETVKSYM